MIFNEEDKKDNKSECYAWAEQRSGYACGIIVRDRSSHSTHRGVSRRICIGEGHRTACTPPRRRRRDRDAEGVDGGGDGEGVSPTQPTRSLGERCKLPQRGPGRRNQIFAHFAPPPKKKNTSKKNASDENNLFIF